MAGRGIRLFLQTQAAPILALLLLVSCAAHPRVRVTQQPEPERVTRIPLTGSGYVYDVAVADGAAWVTTHAGLYEIDLATNEAIHALTNDYLFRVEAGHGAIWITTGGDGRVLRIDPSTLLVTAEIDVLEGPVTGLAMSTDAVWASATSDLVRIDPLTNEIVARLRNQGGFGDIGVGGAGLWAIGGAGREGEVLRIGLGSNEVERRIPLANPSYWNEIVVGDDSVWVTSSPTARREGIPLVSLRRIDPFTGEITAEIPVGDGPADIGTGDGAVSFSGLALGEGSLWVLVAFDGQLVRIRPEDLRVTHVLDGIDTGGSDVGPGFSVGGGSLWFTGPNTVSRLEVMDP